MSTDRNHHHRRSVALGKTTTISLRDRVFGCYLGAAVGDALGGPVQGMHAERIAQVLGGVKDLLPYRKPPGLFEPGPGFALRGSPGCVTDETFVRAQIAQFVIDHEHSRHLNELVRHLTRYGIPERWPPSMLEPLRKVQRGELRPEMAGYAQPPGGGLGWWTAIGIINAGHPDKAAAETCRLSAIWKRPLEQDLLAAVQAGVAHALTPRATVDSLVRAALQQVGPLTRQLIERAVELAQAIPRGNVPIFIDQMYQGALVESAPDEADGEIPAPAFPPPNLEKPTLSPLLAEQVPLAFGALVFGDGRSRMTLCAAASLGRDAKAITSTVGAWIGALVGRSRLPREWVGAVVTVNQDEVDLVLQAQQLADLVEPKTVL